MNVQQAYNSWAENYDTVINKTRDVEGKALRKILSEIDFKTVLEIGCGTGKNTEWLLGRAKKLIGVDFSSEMLERAKEKIKNKKAELIQADITKPWNFAKGEFDLVTCCLILEHIENIDFVFEQANSVLKSGGYFYVGELHPFKQFQGSKAKFETGSGIFELDCFVHQVSDFFQASKVNGFSCVELKEWFDEGDQTSTPRILTMLFRKN
ncbi:MAG: class I SAM-dependent methyltransferase [Pyrinomonadaceae bacterium]|nr:class I SAM-dependent methyltransferase [Pyrinomonadaceae bacterium]